MRTLIIISALLLCLPTRAIEVPHPRIRPPAISVRPLPPWQRV